ncbi:hypothetical protein BT96DRAFT_876007 [Gymnopus androsaceus JB14]|uniref:Amidohydrolase-related domain-containing protein n=1 Tax=Gymnopus androsaceus JB14 TaxID=1447944 RepID=A0A6A4IBN0_9AGAR|nr:hypothetical protein BT96DRAFT_876007 [Gymnopus androsaceus JB14]
MSSDSMDILRSTAFSFPAIDNHAHPLLNSQSRDKVPFEAILSEASGEVALKKDATQTLACYRAAEQLAEILEIEKNQDDLWQKLKEKRDSIEYEELCEMFMKRCGIQSILLDDGLGGVSEWAEDWKWHRRFGCTTKRIVRVEIEAEKLLLPLLQPLLDIEDRSTLPSAESYKRLLSTLVKFFGQLSTSLTNSALDPEVVAFKSIACYRGGLNIRTRSALSISITDSEQSNMHGVVESLLQVLWQFKDKGIIRIAHGVINEWIIHWALRVAGECGIPVQFHTGLGDSDIPLVHASPAYMQPLIEDYPQTIFILLHAAYPFTKEAGYLCSVYPNVMLDFGEIFPMVSGSGQRAALREVLELCPTNKILWSTDGHWHPESFYLGTIQARQALFDVLSEIISAGELTETQAVGIVERALFWNAERVYKLDMIPNK